MSITSPHLSGREELFQRSLTAHLLRHSFAKLSDARVLVAGLGGGSNIAELLARKGIGRLILADPDVYEPHDLRPRGSASNTWGREKVEVMTERPLQINPHPTVTPARDGISLENVGDLVHRSDYLVDMLDFHALPEKVALPQAAGMARKTVVVTPDYPMNQNSPRLHAGLAGAPPGAPAQRFTIDVEGPPLREPDPWP
ncbi:MAG TPA: ThiF family adenylyltransferase [Planctomycetota bacterium]|nr:ThiF family adenylyltransferase [Planctomycetota bacterium]